VRAEIDLNYLGTVYCTYYALPYLKATRGRILGVNSFGGRVGIPATSGYNASKYAMRGFLAHPPPGRPATAPTGHDRFRQIFGVAQ
jgi:short-subunit dehydrogenase